MPDEETKNKAEELLRDHERAIDALHEKLAALKDIDRTKLAEKTATYKAAHRTFHDDCLECWKS